MLRAQTGDLPLPRPTAVSQPFWDGCARGELLFQRCGRCAAVGFPPSEHCRACLARALVWEAGGGRGELYTWSVVRRPVTPAFEVPYAVAVVTLDEGYQMMTNIVDAAVDQLRVGLRVRVVFHQVGDGLYLPYFAPDADLLSPDPAS